MVPIDWCTYLSWWSRERPTRAQYPGSNCCCKVEGEAEDGWLRSNAVDGEAEDGRLRS